MEAQSGQCYRRKRSFPDEDNNNYCPRQIQLLFYNYYKRVKILVVDIHNKYKNKLEMFLQIHMENIYSLNLYKGT